VWEDDMREVFLYRCDRCGNVTCLLNDRGDDFYIDQCVGCKDWSDYSKVVMAKESNMYKESFLFIKEKEDDIKEKQVDEH
jgi:hypothetical protein